MQRTAWVGRWAGDRIVIVGDYTDSGPFEDVYGNEKYTEIVPNINFDE